MRLEREVTVCSAFEGWRRRVLVTEVDEDASVAGRGGAACCKRPNSEVMPLEAAKDGSEVALRGASLGGKVGRSSLVGTLGRRCASAVLGVGDERPRRSMSAELMAPG